MLHLYTSTDPEKLKASGIDGDAVRIHPHIPQEQVFEVLRQADILFLPLAFDSHVPHIVKTASPGKMGEYLALARPILVHAPHGSFITEFFQHNDCGIVVDKNDAGLLAGALSGLLADHDLQDRISQKARRIACEEFALEVVKKNFEDLIFHLDPDKANG
jgi:glycosyltransferase involved in cell wall biosynthesis